MTVLRVYDPTECDEAGVPLDWERCRALIHQKPMRPGGDLIPPDHSLCTRCDGHGSLKAAALARFARKYGPGWDRCGTGNAEGCGHPMSEGMWEGDRHGGDEGYWLDQVAFQLRAGVEPSDVAVHFSPCEEGCRHGGPGRCWYPGGEHGGTPHWDAYEDFTPDAREDTRDNGFGSGEASWRPVDVRSLGWSHDLRPEKLAVLCLRCWAAR